MEDDKREKKNKKPSKRLEALRNCRALIRDEGLLDDGNLPSGCPATHVLATGLDELLAGDCDWEEKRGRLVGLELAQRRTQAQVEELHRLLRRVLTTLEAQGA